MKRLTATLLALLIAAISCSVPTNDEVQEIPQEDLPVALQDPPLIAPTTVAPAGQTVTLFFVQTDSQRLKPVERAAGDGRLLATMRALLLSAATEEERTDNLLNLLATDSQLQELEPVVVRNVVVGEGTNGDLAEVYLSSNFVELQGEGLERAHAQLVYTATAFSRIERVRLFVDGVEEPLSTELGVALEARRRDYPSYDPNLPDPNPSELVLQIPTSTTEAAGE